MKFADYLQTAEGKAVSQTEWARRFGVTRGYVSQLRLSGKVPSLEVAYRIKVLTDGAVTMEDWVPDHIVKEIASGGGHHDNGLRGEDSEEV